MTLSNEVQDARRRALEVARREQQEAALRARENLADLEKAIAAQERLDGIDADLERQIARKTEELRARAEGKRVREQRAAGAAYAAMRDRGTVVKDIARQACVSEKSVRVCIAAFEQAVPAAATTKARGASIASVRPDGEQAEPIAG